jgi:microcystin-dependent protein
MSGPYVGEIRMFAGNFAPAGWALCNGALIPISENETLFNLIGTTYGGDGQSTFALPNLQSRVPVHVGTGFALAQTGGSESVTLNGNQIPAHSHVPQGVTGSPVANPKNTPAANLLADTNLPTNPNPAPFSYGAYVNDANQRTLKPGTVGNTGGNQPHDNMIPFLVINFIISLFGIYPSQS